MTFDARASLRTAVRTFAFALKPTGIRAQGLLAKVMTAIAAGTFTPHELGEARTRHWAHFAEAHHSRKSGLFPWEVRFYREVLKPGVRVLVVGAGSGRDVLCFVRDGCVVTAIDEAPDAIEALRLRLSRAELSATTRAASIAEFEANERFDVVVFSWLAYILIPSRDLRLESLRRAAAATVESGSILISYKPGTGSPRLGRLSRCVATLVGGLRPENFEEFTFSGSPRFPRVYHSRTFTADEIEGEAKGAGLQVIRHHRGAPGWDDPACVVLAPLRNGS